MERIAVMGKISRKSVDYFKMFEKGMQIALKAARTLQASFADGIINESELKTIKEVEHEGDLHVHQCLKTIDVAFITPIDRTDIVEIIKAIECLTDSIDYIATHIHILQITEANEYLMRFVNSVVSSCEILNELMTALKQFKKNQKKINECIIEVNRIEEEGDRTYAESMLHLFQNEKDAIKIIKQKELYQLLENSIDFCEDIADLVEKVMVAKT
ncbi:MAG: DUF47 family protein [Clostridiales bacterium]|nr:DUF47 family protein [Clostridiales bacterium]